MKWSVDYAEERRNGERFFKKRIEEGADITEALRNAKKALLRELFEADGAIVGTFIYTVGMLCDPDDENTVEEIEDED